MVEEKKKRARKIILASTGLVLVTAVATIAYKRRKKRGEKSPQRTRQFNGVMNWERVAVRK